MYVVYRDVSSLPKVSLVMCGPWQTHTVHLGGILRACLLLPRKGAKHSRPQRTAVAGYII